MGSPVYAGKSRSTRPVRRRGQDHPRLCGEKEVLDLRLNLLEGSPPPMRGKVPAAFCHNFQPRITPAYAGKRSTYMLPDVGAWDHPRLCGEKKITGTQVVDSAGSPPPMRGKETAFLCLWSTHRITPAYAGKSKCPRSGHDLR